MTPSVSSKAGQSAGSAKKTAYKIAVLGGDGTGPEVVREGIKVLNEAAKKNSFKLDYINYDLGGERYKKTGEILPSRKSRSILGFLDVLPRIELMD